MNFLNWELLERLDGDRFRSTQPFPWLNPCGALSEEGFQLLLESTPDLSLFTKSFNRARAHGQKSHDRYELVYRPDLPLSPAWTTFIAELKSRRYRRFLKGFFGHRLFDLSFHWQFATNGCSVSPHCDGYSKIGSQLFYFLSPKEWQPEWGGETLVLDSERKLSEFSAPELTEFKKSYATQFIGNYSLLFMKTAHSWHAVNEIQCPPDRIRKIFTVVISHPSWKRKIQSRMAKFGLRKFGSSVPVDAPY